MPMPRDREQGKIIAHIANPGLDARNARKSMQKQLGEEQAAGALIPNSGQILIGSRRLIDALKRKTQIRHILTGRDSKHDLV